MTEWSIAEAARVLLAAEDAGTSRGPLTAEWPGLDVRTAYAVQDEALRLRLSRGEKLIGVKLGLTSKAKQERMGVDRPVLAWLTDAMVLPSADPLPPLIHPRAEPEIVFVLGSRLCGPGVTAATAMEAVSRVYGGLEIIDSRYSDFRFSAADTIADNASSSVFRVGPVGIAPGIDLSLEACLLEVDGAVVDSATGAAVLGNPGEALALAANSMADRGLALEAGWIVLTGGMTDAVPVSPGARVAAHFTNLGSVTVSG
ncbi:fumarylacetoacetate hydrolase family protein [Amycolatopsis endophytica]|uniref:2-oxo-3-hexenedioate decarboxylase n=1 Tax=Amycolatopsis endophytica TaxID=860233 RepID=A0A853B485_9PSEU|nr:fumarylacetoacetate hydrolase family protein [Amycolatopsis endophytica]NYI89993.1 2-oxo-3-hexenedioate decarboxylase [Amycolatopsis endophytica]